MTGLNLLLLNKEQRAYYWEEYEKAYAEFEEAIEETVKNCQEELLNGGYDYEF